MLGWTPSSFDSYNVLYNLVDTRKDSGQGKFNLGGYANAEIDAITEKIISETDSAKRDALIRDAYRILHDDVGLYPAASAGPGMGQKDSVDLLQRADNQFHVFHVKVK